MIEALPSPPEFPSCRQPLPTAALILQGAQCAVGGSQAATVGAGTGEADERPLAAKRALKCQRRPEEWSWGSGGLLTGPRLFLGGKWLVESQGSFLSKEDSANGSTKVPTS